MSLRSIRATHCFTYSNAGTPVFQGRRFSTMPRSNTGARCLLGPRVRGDDNGESLLRVFLSRECARLLRLDIGLARDLAPLLELGLDQGREGFRSRALGLGSVLRELLF